MEKQTMRGVVFLGDCEVEVREFPMPRPSDGQVLIQMKRAAICGSDLHVYRNPKSYFEGKSAWIPGHEPSGIVAGLGPGCRRVREGDRVTIYHWLACGHCRYCLKGYYQWCEHRRGLGQPDAVGPDADYMVVDERNCLPLPDELNFDDGAMIACIAATCFSSMRKLRPNGEDTVAIFGQGPVGLTGNIMAQAMGARVVGVDIVEERLALARVLGVNETVNPSASELVRAIGDLTGGVGADAAFETSGSSDAHQGVVDVLRPGGRGVFVGFGASGPTINASSIIGKELTLMGSFVMPIHYYWDLAEFMIEHGLSAKYQQMITHRFPLEEATAAFALANSAKAGKIVFAWD